jgi:hypothetical protein
MTIQDLLLPAPAALGRPSGSALPNRSFALRVRVADWLATAAGYYTAATVYERLSGLSDAELQLRGLSRATLASDIVRWCDRTNV